MVSTLSSGRGGEPPNAPALISLDFVDRLALGDGLGGVDLEERRRLLAARRGGDRVGGDRAADRPDRHDDVDVAARGSRTRRCSGSNWTTLILPASFGLLSSSALSIDDLVGGDVVLPQDHLEQLDVARRCGRSRRGAGRPVCSIFSIFGLLAAGLRGAAAPALPLAQASAGFAARRSGTMNTTTFLRRMATAWPSFGMPMSRRTTARSAWPLVDAPRGVGGPPSLTTWFAAGCWTGRARTARRSPAPRGCPRCWAGRRRWSARSAASRSR